MAARRGSKRKTDEREPLSVHGTCRECKKEATINFGVIPIRLDLILPIQAYCRDCQSYFSLDDTKG